MKRRGVAGVKRSEDSLLAGTRATKYNFVLPAAPVRNIPFDSETVRRIALAAGTIGDIGVLVSYTLRLERAVKRWEHAARVAGARAHALRADIDTVRGAGFEPHKLCQAHSKALARALGKAHRRMLKLNAELAALKKNRGSR